MRLVPLKEDGTPDIDALNTEFSKEYLADKRNPRWVAKPTVAYFWARTVKCKNCRATIPLLKTRWLCKKERKRVLLTMEPNADKTGVGLRHRGECPGQGRQRRPAPRARQAHRRRDDVAVRGQVPVLRHDHDDGGYPAGRQAGRLGATNTAVVVDGPDGQGVPTADRSRD